MSKELDNVCSYCLVKDLKKQAKVRYNEIRVKPSRGELRGVNVFEVPAGCRVDLDDPTNHQKYWKAWFLSVQDHCTC